MILESGIVEATNLDLLSVGRLNALPYNGTLTMQFQSSAATSTNFFQVTVQKPDGDVPVDLQMVPAGSVVGELDSDKLLQMTFRATQGGHFTVSLTENGTAVCAYRMILRP